MLEIDIEKRIVNGAWEGYIGRVNRQSIRVFTGKRMSGVELNNFFASGSLDNTKLKVYGPDGPIYLTYESIDISSPGSVAAYSPRVFVEERTLERFIDNFDQYVEGSSGVAKAAAQEALDAKEQLTTDVGQAITTLNEDKQTAINELNEVKESNRKRYLDPVATVAERDSKYPTPANGDSVWVSGEGKMYRYNGTEWKVTNENDPAAIDQVNQQLADTVSNMKVLNVNSQVDYVNDLQKLASHGKQMSVEVVYGGSQLFHVNVRLSPTKGVTYRFLKNSNDDYILQQGSYVGDVEEIYAVTDSFNFTKSSGVINNSTYPNNYTTEVGAVIGPETFTGTRVDFYSHAENRGGIWEFILDEGTVGERRKEISVWNSSIVYKQQTLFENLDLKKHTVKGVFKGADPNNPPTTAPARGWIYVGGVREQDQYRTFYVYNDTFKINKTADALYSASNKDFALQARPAGSTVTMDYIPEHNTRGTAFKIVDAKLLADGKRIPWVASTYAIDTETVQLIQKVHGIHSSEPDNPLVEITTYHTIKDGVLTMSGSLKFLRDTEVGYGYALMFPYWTSFADIILTSKGNKYEVRKSDDKTTEYWAEKDENRSVMILNTSASDDRSITATAMTIDNFKQTMRLGEPGTGNPESWIEHRSASLGKIYFNQFRNVTIPAGYEYKYDGRYITTMIPEVKELFI